MKAREVIALVALALAAKCLLGCFSDDEGSTIKEICEAQSGTECVCVSGDKGAMKCVPKDGGNAKLKAPKSHDNES